jgi:hypothetical protein
MTQTAIPNQHTDRSAYDTTRPVDPAQLAALRSLIARNPTGPRGWSPANATATCGDCFSSASLRSAPPLGILVEPSVVVGLRDRGRLHRGAADSLP